MLALIPYQIWLYFCSIICILYFIWDFIVWVMCERECEDLSAYWRKCGFREKPSRKVSHGQSTWLECEESWQLGFVSISQVRPSREIPAKHLVLLFWHIYYTISSCTLYIPPLPTYWEECFQRENPRHNPWELEIVILTILYTIIYGFPQLLPLYIQILERLIAQTLTTPILSVKWGFGVTGKYWKKPFVWWMQSGWIAWFGELEKTRLR